MDFLALWFSIKITHGKVKPVRMCISSSVGAAYAVAAIFIAQNKFLSLISEIAVAFVICLITFGGKRLYRNVVIFMMISFLIGGSMTALYSVIGTGGIFQTCTEAENGETQSIYLGKSMIVLAIGIMSVWLCVKILSYVKTDRSVTVEITICGKKVFFEALTDSGNLLTEPISGFPVIIADSGILKNIVKNEVYEKIEQGDYAFLAVNNEDKLKFRLLFAHGIGGEKTLIGIIPDNAEINGIEKSICLGLERNGTKFNGKSGLVPLCILQ